MPCNTIDRLITGYLLEWLMVLRNASLHKYARPTTRSANLFGTVSWFCMVAPLMSKLWDATVAEVAPLSNPTLSGKKPSACPRELSHILFWVRVLPMGQDAHHFQHGIVSNTVSIMLDQAEERRQEIWTRTSCTQIPGKIPRHHGISVWFSQF